MGWSATSSRPPRTPLGPASPDSRHANKLEKPVQHCGPSESSSFLYLQPHLRPQGRDSGMQQQRGRPDKAVGVGQVDNVQAQSPDTTTVVPTAGPSRESSTTLPIGGTQIGLTLEIEDVNLTSRLHNRNDAPWHTAAGLDRSSTFASVPNYAPHGPHHDTGMRPLQGNWPNERIPVPSAPPHVTYTWSGMRPLPDSLHESHIPGPPHGDHALGDIGFSSVPKNLRPYPNNTPNVPQTNGNHNLLGLAPPLQRYSHSHSSHPPQTSGHPNLVQNPTERSFPAASTPHSRRPQNTSLPQNNSVAHSGLQAHLDSIPLDHPPDMDALSGPSSDVSLPSHLREPIDASEMQVSNLSARYYGQLSVIYDY